MQQSSSEVLLLIQREAGCDDLKCSVPRSDACHPRQAGTLELVSEGRDNPMHAAVRAGRGELIEVLLAAGARIDVRDDKWVANTQCKNVNESPISGDGNTHATNITFKIA